MDTLLLDTQRWDLVGDLSGNIAVASDPYSMAQDAATAIKTFEGEVYYDTTLGVPYWQQILGKLPPLSLVKAQLVAAAETVLGVVSAQAFLTGSSGRTLTGQVQIEDSTGAVTPAGF
jgi:hypothetical protein